MPQLDYETPAAKQSGQKKVAMATWAAAGIIVVANLLLLNEAHGDRSYGAMFVAVVAGPFVNVFMSIALLACGAALQRRCGGVSIAWYRCVAITLPLCAIPGDALVIFSMRLHGV